MTDILAIDLATTAGYARGKLGDAVPVCGSIAFGGRGRNLGDAVFSQALHWISDIVNDGPPPDIVIVEKMLPPEAMQNRTSRAVRDRLAGLHGIVRAVAHRHGVGEISEASVGDVRAHFIGQRGLKRYDAKRAVISRCRQLGWDVANDNEADACALWSFACGLLDPSAALRTSPLFNPKLRVSVWP